MAKFGMSSLVGMFAVARDGDGVDVGTEDGPLHQLEVEKV